MTHEKELPPDKVKLQKRAVRLEIVSLIYLASAITILYFTLGNSQAMKVAWVEDILSLIPPIAFLVSTRARDRKANGKFPYGYHRATSIAYLCGSIALLSFGLFLFVDSALKLIALEHPSIGTVVLFGNQVWLGWLMIPALIYSGLPMMILGKMKLPLARALHDKALYADAEMMFADWKSVIAAIAGIIGIAFGLWWADGVAASIISLDIVRDGVSNVRQVARDLMDHVPTTVDHKSIDPLPARVESEMRKLRWVRDVKARLREEGHVYFGEVLVIPATQAGLLGNIEEAHHRLRELDWRLHDVVIAPVKEFHDEVREIEGQED